MEANITSQSSRSSARVNDLKPEFLNLSQSDTPIPRAPDSHLVTPCNSPTQQFARKVLPKGPPRPKCCIYDDVYYAVLSGRSPGVYLGRDETAYAAGTNGRTIIYRSTNKAKADAIFTKAYNNEGVVVWGETGVGHIHASVL